MASIEIVTEVPGPRSRALADRASKSVARPIGPARDVYIASGQGAVITDVDENSYLDFIGGVGALVVGHAHPRVVAAVAEQAGRFMHTDFSLIPYSNYLELAEKISALAGGNRKVALFNSGAEAVENAVKVARGKTRRPGIVCFEGAFHGRTFMAMTLTFREEPIKKGFGPFAPGVYRVPYPGFRGATLDQSLSALEVTLKQQEVAGVIVEPVLGEGGFIVPPKGFLSGVSSLCRKHGAAFIADEVQTGYFRTGTFLATQQAEVTPDIVVIGKGIAAGIPLSGLVADPEFIDALVPGALGGTYPGNPLACAAGLAVLEVVEEESLASRSVEIGKRLTERWESIDGGTGKIAEVRGLGSMVGVEFSDSADVKEILASCLRKGVMLMTAGKEEKVIRHLMPLVITDDQVDEALDVIEASVTR